MSTQPILQGQGKGSTNRELENMTTIVSVVMPKSAKNLSVLRSILIVVLEYIITPLECFLRVDHGERTLSELRVFNTLVAMQILWILSSAISALAEWVVGSSPLAGLVEVESSSMSVSPVLQVAFLIAAACHLWRISYRRRKGIIWHSMSAGISIFEVIGLLDLVNRCLGSIRLFGGWRIPYRVTRWTIYLYIEPLVGILAAHIIQRFDAPTAGWIFASSLCLFVRNHMMHAEQRHRVLDYFDSQIDSEFIQDAADQRPPQETAGVMVIPGFAEALAHAEKLDIAGRVNKTFSSE